MNRRVHIIVHGNVQGVFFRASVRDIAGRVGLSGFVKNLPGGTVEAVFEGESFAIEKAIGFCRLGPPGSRVDRLDLTEEPFTGGFDGFVIIYD